MVRRGGRATTGSYVYHGNGCGAHGVSQVAIPACTTAAPPSPLGTDAPAVCGNTLTYICDASGNVVGGSTLTASYDFNNQPWTITRAGAGTTQFAYDPNGDRFKELSSSQSTWFGGRGVERTVSGGTTTDRHELGPVVIDRVGTTDTVYYQLRDRLGSPGAVGTGANAPDTRSFGAFGEARYGNFGARNNGTLNLAPKSLRGFTAHEHLDDVYLIHMNGRVYDYGLGRFLSVDPVVQFPANSQSLNPYSYILNNPLSGKDPSGYECIPMTGTNICGHDTGAVNGQSTETKTTTDAQTGQKTYTKTVTAAGTTEFIQKSESGARMGQGTTPVAQVDGSKNGASGIDDVERDPAQQQLRSAAETGREVASGFYTGLNVLVPQDATDVAIMAGTGPLLRLGGRAVRLSGDLAGDSLGAALDGIEDAAKLRMASREAELSGVGASGGTFRSFTSDNFRENLTRLTGGIPDGAQAHHIFPQASEFSGQF